MITRNDLESGQTYYMPTNGGIISYVFMTKLKFRKVFKFRTISKKYPNAISKHRTRFTYRYESFYLHEDDFASLYKDSTEAYRVYANIIVKEYNDVLQMLDNINKVERLLTK